MTPVYGALIKRKGNHLTVRCNQSREEYHMRCFNMKWVGNIQNCSAGKLLLLVRYQNQSVEQLQLFHTCTG